MKRILFISLVMFIVLSAFPQQVTRQEAVNAAVNTIKYNGRSNLSNFSVSSINSKNKGDTVLIYEVHFQSGEIVLLSGNKACTPVLGYSLSTLFSASQSILDNNADIPDGLRDMLSEYEEQILICFRNNLNSKNNEWQALQHFESGRSITTEIVSPLLTTEWGQHRSNDLLNLSVCNAYNYYVNETNTSCTCGNSQNCPTGCVATAMAQIMNYWKYPVWLPNKVEQYDWCNMPDKLLCENNPNYIVERNAIARLMKDCGTAVNMEYCRNGCISAASDLSVPDAFMSFGYSNDVILFKKKEYITTLWLNMIKNDLDNGYPVYYRGEDDYGLYAHAFVCDGYRSDNTFHFNWGWNGSFNSFWWTIDQLYPSLYSYNSKQAAIFNIHPNATQDYCTFEIPLKTHYNLYYNIFGNTSPYPYENVPKTFMRMTSVPNDPQYPSAWRTIPTGATSEYVAHVEIVLQDGFYAESGCDFLAHIEPCESCTMGTMSEIIDNISEYDNSYDTILISKSARVRDNGAGITDADASDASLRVYPNPTGDLLSIEMDGARIVNVALYDLQGRPVRANNHSPLRTGANDTPLPGTSATLDLHDIPAGVYILRVIATDGHEHHQKIVKR